MVEDDLKKTKTDISLDHDQKMIAQQQEKGTG